MAKQKFRITNLRSYNKALINRGSLTFWLDDQAIQAWYESATPSPGEGLSAILTPPSRLSW